MKLWPEGKFIAYLMLVGGVGFLFHAAWTLVPATVTARARQRLSKVELSHFLLIALVAGAVMVVALGGAWWKSRQLPEPAERTGSPATSSTPTIVPGIAELPTDVKARLRPIVYDLEEIVVTKSQQPLMSVKGVASQMELMLGQPNASELLAKLILIRQQLGELDDKIYSKLIPDHQHFAKELRPLVGKDESIQDLMLVIGAFTDGLEGLIANLERLQVKDKNAVNNFMMPYFISHRYTFRQPVQNFERWISDSSTRIEKMKQELR